MPDVTTQVVLFLVEMTQKLTHPSYALQFYKHRWDLVIQEYAKRIAAAIQG